MAVEIDLMPDGTVRDRVWNPLTGVIDHEQLRPGRWVVSDGRLQEFVSRRPLLGLFGGGVAQQGWDHRATWEGPDRLRLEDVSASRPTMIWVRSRGE